VQNGVAADAVWLPSKRASVDSFDLLDYLIGLYQQRWGHLNAQCIRGLDINHQIKSVGLLDWQIFGSGTSQNV
jgi:hypothetical protein